MCLFQLRDGLVDLTKGTRDVTISWSTFSDHDKVMLISANEDDVEDENTRVTLHLQLVQGNTANILGFATAKCMPITTSLIGGTVTVWAVP